MNILYIFFQWIKLYYFINKFQINNIYLKEKVCTYLTQDSGEFFDRKEVREGEVGEKMKNKEKRIGIDVFFMLLKNLKPRFVFHVNSLSISAGLEKVSGGNRSASLAHPAIHLSETVISDAPFRALFARTMLYAHRSVLRILPRK